MTEIDPSHVVPDGNHPLAVMAPRPTVQVRDRRDATDDEIEARSVGNGGISLLDRVRPAGPLH